MYFVPKTIKDILEMQERGDSESATLEFKSSRLFSQKNEKVFETLSREITAFANSIGGVLIIGVEEDKHRVISEIDPITDEKKDESWIEDGLLSRISPKMYISIAKIQTDKGYLLVIDVPVSRNAPHQASDKRYYARRLYRVDQLLAYEIDDIRRRTIADNGGAKLSLIFQSGSINYEIENTSIGPIFDVWIEIEGIEKSAIANEWSPSLNRPYTEPFKIIQSKEKRSFLGASFQFFQRHLEDEMIVKLHYLDEDRQKHAEHSTYYLQDFETTTRLRTPQEVLLQQGVENLEKLEKTIAKLAGDIHAIRESAFLPTGLNFSETTLSVLAGEKNIKWPGESLSFMALAEILEVDTNMAFEIQRTIFGASTYMGGKNQSLNESKLPDDLKEKIINRLKLPIDIKD